MPAPPLSHHDILGLVEPFTRRGRHVDLGASDRAARRLVFRPAAAAADALRETLQLDCRADGSFRLTRLLDHPCGLQASLQAEGRDAGALLARIEAQAGAAQFSAGPGYVIAWQQRLDAGATQPLLTQGVARLEGLRLTLGKSTHGRAAADLALTPQGPGLVELPDDLLAVLGWNWAPLLRGRSGWTSKLRLGGGEPQRSLRAQARLEAAARHLAQTLAEPPGRFHERHRRARWGVVFRRSIPVLTAVSVVGGAVGFTLLPIELPTLAQMLLYHVPTLLLALGFCLQEMARFEIPPRPRPQTAASWWGAERAPAAGAVDGTAATAAWSRS